MQWKAFLKLLGQTTWSLRPDGEIIRDVPGYGYMCPYLYVRDELNALGTGDKRTPIKRGGRTVKREIFDAADNYSGHNRAIRRDLLKACGLETR